MRISFKIPYDQRQEFKNTGRRENISYFWNSTQKKGEIEVENHNKIPVELRKFDLQLQKAPPNIAKSPPK
jgi:hypothetical protein